MKKLIILFLGSLLMIACTGTSYSKLLKEEKKTIANYIDREGIRTTGEWPGYKEWPSNLYYEVPGYDYLYFHMIAVGDTSYIDDDGKEQKVLPVAASETVIMRYKKYGLNWGSDTISYWTTQENPYPMEFKYLTESVDCVAWQLATQLMKYSNAHCRIICPSKLGESAAQSSVTPYGYELHMRIKR